MVIRAYEANDIGAMQVIWNDVVEEGNSFPQVEPLNYEQAVQFLGGQTYTGVAVEEGGIVGLYILHPNNVGRCGHIANASYAVKAGQRGRHIGEKLVEHSLSTAASFSFKILQFNAVVASNKGAVHLYKKLRFTPLGRIPGGFMLKNGTYEDILPFYITLD